MPRDNYTTILSVTEYTIEQVALLPAQRHHCIQIPRSVETVIVMIICCKNMSRGNANPDITHFYKKATLHSGFFGASPPKLHTHLQVQRFLFLLEILV